MKIVTKKDHKALGHFHINLDNRRIEDIITQADKTTIKNKSSNIIVTDVLSGYPSSEIKNKLKSLMSFH